MQIFPSTLLLLSATAAAAVPPPCNLAFANVLARGDFGQLDDLIQGRPAVQVNCMLEDDSQERMPSFMYAYRRGDNRIAQMLLEMAREAGNTDFVAYVDGQGRTALHEVCASGARDVLELLLNDEDVDASAQDDQGRTPLMLAVLSASPSTKSMMKLLLSRQVDLSLSDMNGYQVFDYIKEASPSLMSMVQETEAYADWYALQPFRITALFRRATTIQDDYARVQAHRKADLGAIAEGIRRRFEAAPKDDPALPQQGRLATITDADSDDEYDRRPSSSKGSDGRRSSSALSESESDDDEHGKDPMSEPEDGGEAYRNRTVSCPAEDGEAHRKHKVTFPKDGAPVLLGNANSAVDTTGQCGGAQQATALKSELPPAEGFSADSELPMNEPAASSNGPESIVDQAMTAAEEIALLANAIVSTAVENVDDFLKESKAAEQPDSVHHVTSSSGGSGSSTKSNADATEEVLKTEEPAKPGTVSPPQEAAKAEDVKDTYIFSGFFLSSRCSGGYKNEDGKRLIFPAVALIGIIFIWVGTWLFCRNAHRFRSAKP